MALPVVPILAGVAVAAALVYVFRDKIGKPRNLVDQAQAAVKDTADAAVDAAEAVSDKAGKVATDIKRSVT